MKKFALSLLILLSVTISAFAEWRIDAEGEGLPHNFRSMKDNWHIVPEGTPPSRIKMEHLRISASAQPAEKEFVALAERLRQLAQRGPIYVVDLRQESHGFADGYNVFWHEKRNLANFGLSAAEVMAKEHNELYLLLNKSTDFVYSGKNDTEALKHEIITLKPKTVKNESAVAKSVGLHYARFACPDQMWPDDATVDEFLAFVKALPKNSWLHFHCQSGHGRTTTFLVFSEILANPKIPLETIVARQYLLGGTNLLAKIERTRKKDDEKRRRAYMIRKFYTYANELDDGKTSLTWSEWIKNNQ